MDAEKEVGVAIPVGKRKNQKLIWKMLGVRKGI